MIARISRTTLAAPRLHYGQDMLFSKRLDISALVDKFKRFIRRLSNRNYQTRPPPQTSRAVLDRAFTAVPKSHNSLLVTTTFMSLWMNTAALKEVQGFVGSTRVTSNRRRSST